MTSPGYAFLQGPTSTQAQVTLDKSKVCPGPDHFLAPEVIDGLAHGKLLATRAADIYMFGGLLFELMTCGNYPFSWIRDQESRVLIRRRQCPVGETIKVDDSCSGGEIEVKGLQGLSTLDAVLVDNPKRQTYYVIDGCETMRVGYDDLLSAWPVGAIRLIDIMKKCLSPDPKGRPTAKDVVSLLDNVLACSLVPGGVSFGGDRRGPDGTPADGTTEIRGPEGLGAGASGSGIVTGWVHAGGSQGHGGPCSEIVCATLPSPPMKSAPTS